MPVQAGEHQRCQHPPEARAGPPSLCWLANWPHPHRGQGQTKERQAPIGSWQPSQAKEVALEACRGQPHIQGSCPYRQDLRVHSGTGFLDQPLTSPGLILGTAPTSAGSRAHSPKPGCQGAAIAWVPLVGQPEVMSSPWPPPSPVRNGTCTLKCLKCEEGASLVSEDRDGMHLVVGPVKLGASKHSQVQLAACFVNKALLAHGGGAFKATNLDLEDK